MKLNIIRKVTKEEGIKYSNTILGHLYIQTPNNIIYPVANGKPGISDGIGADGNSLVADNIGIDGNIYVEDTGIDGNPLIDDAIEYYFIEGENELSKEEVIKAIEEYKEKEIEELYDNPYEISR